MNAEVGTTVLCDSPPVPEALSSSGLKRNAGPQLKELLVRFLGPGRERMLPLRLSDKVHDTLLAPSVDCSTVSTGRGIDSIFDPDLRSRYMSESAAKERGTRRTYHAYGLRIEALRSDAALDGFAMNEASREDFWSFVGALSFAQRAGLVLMDNGNLRAVWKGDSESRVGVQFLGGRLAEYVIFKRRQAAGAVSRVAGRDTLDGIKKQIRAFDLAAMMGL